jgi:hypothetical protein
MSSLPTFTLESLVVARQWSAAQRSNRKKAAPAKPAAKTENSSTSEIKAAK